MTGPDEFEAPVLRVPEGCPGLRSDQWPCSGDLSAEDADEEETMTSVMARIRAWLDRPSGLGTAVGFLVVTCLLVFVAFAVAGVPKVLR